MDKELATYRDQLKKALSSRSPNLEKCSQLFIRSKILMTKLDIFNDEPNKANVDVLYTAREILEFGAYYSVRTKDIYSFERYIAQLNTFYHDLATVLKVSTEMETLIGLNLLRLLAQNRLADFHIALETVDPDQLHNSQYIKQAVDLEQFLMEGRYNKVREAREQIKQNKHEEFLFFYDILIDTVRKEIANCSEKAYESLPLQDVRTLLFLENNEDPTPFINKNWKVSPAENPAERMVTFGSDENDAGEIPHEEIIKNNLSYAKELERIV